ncbi:MAG: methyltransferase domain-containing protein [bacterium]|nr:methyltransferase domain-containing protein [bacterium]
MLLNLGCGRDIRKGYINVDKALIKGVDVVCDIEKGLPFKAGAFEGLFCRYVLEHVGDLIGSMSEIHRILKLGGVAHIEVPHCSWFQSYSDPTHKHFFTSKTMDCFDEKSEEGYFLNIKFKFKIITKKLSWGENYRFRILNSIINSVINCFPAIYERFLLWVLPINKIIFEMKAVK